MSRTHLLAAAILALSSASSFALQTAPSWMCAIPSAKETFHSLDQVPQPVAALLLKKYPDLKKSMADCPQFGPTDQKSFCLYVATHFNDEWVTVVSTRGSAPLRIVSVYRNSKEVGTEELSLLRTGIPQCSINRIAGVNPRSQSARSAPRPTPPAPQNGSSPGNAGSKTP